MLIRVVVYGDETDACSQSPGLIACIGQLPAAGYSCCSLASAGLVAGYGQRLAQEEYRQSLTSMLQNADAQYNAVRIGRLVGVLLKQPFAIPVALAEASSRTAAYRAWHLLEPSEFDIRFAATIDGAPIWQVKVLKQMMRELGLQDASPYEFAKTVQNEYGFFGRFAQTISRYICADKAIRKKVADALKAAKATGTTIPHLTPESIIGMGGLSLGVYLVHAVPILGLVEASVIGALVVILYTLGVDAFCHWSTGLSTSAEERN